MMSVAKGTQTNSVPWCQTCFQTTCKLAAISKVKTPPARYQTNSSGESRDVFWTSIFSSIFLWSFQVNLNLRSLNFSKFEVGYFSPQQSVHIEKKSEKTLQSFGLLKIGTYFAYQTVGVSGRKFNNFWSNVFPKNCL